MKKNSRAQNFDNLRYTGILKRSRPFFMSGVGYYLLSSVVALTIFLIVWAILIESGDAASFIPAGIIGGLFLIAAFVLREVLLRRERMATILAHERLDSNINAAASKAKTSPRKLSLRSNQELLKQIYEKSKAAKVLKRLPDGHWEAFELCDSYLRLTRKEIARTHINSPRIGPITKSRGRIKKLHRFHLLKWAKARASMLMLKSKESGIAESKRIESARMAQITIETALEFYPREKNLLDSLEAIHEYIVSVKISGKVNEAENACTGGDIGLAIEIYKDTLVQLNASELRKREKDLITDRINSEIMRLQD